MVVSDSLKALELYEKMLISNVEVSGLHKGENDNLYLIRVRFHMLDENLKFGQSTKPDNPNTTWFIMVSDINEAQGNQCRLYRGADGY